MKYVALLRGINVGGNNTVSMAELKKCFAAQGFAGATTYINSGNVIFNTDEAETGLIDTIEWGIKNNFDLDIPVVIRSHQQIAEVVRRIPKNWANDASQRTDVLFLWQEADYPEVLKEIATNPAVDNILYMPGAVVWNFDRANYGKSELHNFIGTKIYKLMTARNVNTVRKLLVLMDAI